MPEGRYAISANVRGLIVGAGTPDEWIQPWEEFWRVLGQREDYGDGDHVRITLDHINGDFFDLLDDDPGYSIVIENLSSFVPGLSPKWYDRVLSMPVNDPNGPAVLWERG